MLTNIARGSENTAAQRLSPWRKGTRRRDRRATSPESARARARADAASAQPQSEARAKSPQGHPASRGRRALCETTSVTGAFCSNGPALTHAFCNDKARVRVLLHSAAWGEPCRMFPRASAGTFLLRLPIGESSFGRIHKAVKRLVSWSCRCLQRIAHCIASRRGQALELLLQLQ